MIAQSTFLGAVCRLALPLAAAAASLPAVLHAMPLGGPQTAGGRGITVLPDSSASRVVAMVYQGRYSYVRVESRETGSNANEHPAAIAPAVLRRALAEITLKNGGATEPLFGAAPLDEIVGPLAQALARATPSHDVTFAVSGQYDGFGPFASRSVTTGRMYFAEGALHLVLGLVRRDFENELRGTGVLLAFEPGRRASPLSRDAHVSAAGATPVRTDWLRWQRQVLEANASTPVAPGFMAPAEVPSPEPAVRIGTKPPHGATASADADTLFRLVAERLRALQKLREAQLITEAEYQDKRRAILGEL